MSRLTAALTVLSGVLFAVASGPATASAATPAFSASAITSPGNAAYEFWDQDSESGDVTVTGTVTNPTATAKGDIVCYSPEAKPAKLAGPISVSSGSFSVDVDLGTAYGEACRVLMVPDAAGVFPGEGSDLSTYSGPALSIADQLSHSSNGNLYGYFIESGTLQWSWGFQSAGECPVSASYQTDPSTLYYTQLFAGNACLPYDTGIAPDLNSRSSLEIDGLNAYVPGDLGGSPGPNLTGVAGFEPLQYTPYFDALHTTVAIGESDIPTICAAPGTFPPTIASCPSLQPTGIEINQISSTADGGSVARLQQTFTNLAKRSHTLDILFTQSVVAPESGEEPGFEFPGQTTVAAHAEPDAFNEFPAGPGSIIVVGDSQAAPTEGNPVGAITYSQPPQSANFITAAGATDSSANSLPVSTFTMHYVVTLAPGQSTTYGWSFAQADSAGALSLLEPAERDRFLHPTISFVSPARRAVSARARITVTGLAADPVGLSSVTLDGRHVSLRAGGKWSASVQLHLGVNQLVAVATNDGGVTATASRVVTFRNECVVPALRGRLLLRAREVLRRARCAVGTIVSVRSLTVRKGRVIRSAPGAGSTRSAGSRVGLYVSRGRSRS
jgi:hypothetical protein